MARPLRYHDFETRLPQARAAFASAPNDLAAILTFADWYAFRGVDDWAVEFYEKARSAGAAFPQIEFVILGPDSATTYLTIQLSDVLFSHKVSGI